MPTELRGETLCRDPNRCYAGLKPKRFMKLLSRSEEVVLLSIWRLQDEAYGVSIRKQASEATGRDWSIGALYAPLHRLEKKGYVQTHKGEPVSKRGGRSKVYYHLTPAGKQALLAIKHVHETLWTGIPALGTLSNSE